MAPLENRLNNFKCLPDGLPAGRPAETGDYIISTTRRQHAARAHLPLRAGTQTAPPDVTD